VVLNGIARNHPTFTKLDTVANNVRKPGVMMRGGYRNVSLVLFMMREGLTGMALPYRMASVWPESSEGTTLAKSADWPPIRMFTEPARRCMLSMKLRKMGCTREAFFPIN